MLRALRPALRPVSKPAGYRYRTESFHQLLTDGETPISPLRHYTYVTLVRPITS